MTRATVWMFGFLLSATTVAAQTPPPLSSTTTTLEQPVVRHSLAVEGEAVRPVRGWSTSAAVEMLADGVVTAHGPGIRLTPAADLTVYRSALKLAGEFSVGAVFQTGQPNAIHGLTLGGEPGMRFLVRSDGAFTTQGAGLGGWSRVALRPATDDAPGANHLEVRVDAASVTFVINGQVVQTLAITPGQLDGVPGLHIGAGGDVAVAGFMVQTANAVIPEAGK